MNQIREPFAAIRCGCRLDGSDALYRPDAIGFAASRTPAAGDARTTGEVLGDFAGSGEAVGDAAGELDAAGVDSVVTVVAVGVPEVAAAAVPGI
jgi:hypothetical protein